MDSSFRNSKKKKNNNSKQNKKLSHDSIWEQICAQVKESEKHNSPEEKEHDAAS